MIRLEWKPQDLWIGAFWKTARCKTDSGEVPFITDVWICIVPCLPIYFQIHHKVSIANVVTRSRSLAAKLGAAQ